MLLRVLVAARTPDVSTTIRRVLEAAGPDVLIDEAHDLERLHELASASPHDLLVLSDRLLQPTPFSTLGALDGLPGAPEIVVVTASAEARERTAYLAAGVLAVLELRAGEGALAAALEAILERHRARVAAEAQASILAPDRRLGDYVTNSPRMREFLRPLPKIASSHASVLLLGETGSGKEFLARALHDEGPRRALPFIALNCAAVPEGLIESELFGHARGAFTGAVAARRGCFELAHGGTLFLDEIGELPISSQAKLLRVLEDKRIRPVGAESTIDVDVRIVAATNRDIHEAVRAGTFREDLYYRIGVVTLTIPPLRERPEDIRDLVAGQIERLAARMGRPISGVHPDALAVLTSYRWPGNVRELINVIERAVLLAEGAEIGLGDLPADLVGSARAAASVDAPLPPSEALTSKTFPRARAALLADFERRYFEALLTETQGRIGAAAERAGITPRALYDKLKKLGLQKEAFRRGASRSSADRAR